MTLQSEATAVRRHCLNELAFAETLHSGAPMYVRRTSQRNSHLNLITVCDFERSWWICVNRRYNPKRCTAPGFRGLEKGSSRPGSIRNLGQRYGHGTWEIENLRFFAVIPSVSDSP